MKTVSKGKLFRVTTVIDDDRLKQLRKAPEILYAAVEVGAEYWHSRILPGHFESGASGKYGYAPRSLAYIRRNKGKPSLVHSGSMRNDLTARAQFKQTAGSVELKMTARALNFAPQMPQNTADLYVVSRKGRGYPNMKREIMVVLEDEREAIAEVVTRELEQKFKPTGE
jgi:hypothetical protein